MSVWLILNVYILFSICSLHGGRGGVKRKWMRGKGGERGMEGRKEGRKELDDGGELSVVGVGERES